VDRKAAAKVLLTRLGSVCNARAIFNLNGVFNYRHVGWWLAHTDFDQPYASARAKSSPATSPPRSPSGLFLARVRRSKGRFD
jgi:hypothetical protein